MSRQQAKDPRISVDVIYDDMEKAMPLGAIIAYGGSTAPAGWHLCDGSAHNSPALQAALGSSTTPDLRGRFILAAGQGAGNDSKGNEMVLRVQGATGGAQTVRLTWQESGVPVHGHGITDPGHAHQLPGPDGNAAFVTSAVNWGWYERSVTAYAPTLAGTTGISVNPSTAADAANGHENMPPFYVLTYIIRKGWG